MNPILIIPADEVLAWLRQRADEAGYVGQPICAVQISVEYEFQGGQNYHSECPKLVVMLSNIKNAASAAKEN